MRVEHLCTQCAVKCYIKRSPPQNNNLRGRYFNECHESLLRRLLFEIVIERKEAASCGCNSSVF